MKQNCITNCKLSNLTHYRNHIPPARQPRRKHKIGFNLNTELWEWKTWRRTFILALHFKCRATLKLSLQSSTHLILTLHGGTAMTRRFGVSFYWFCFKLTGNITVVVLREKAECFDHKSEKSAVRCKSRPNYTDIYRQTGTVELNSRRLK